jgi:Family of unknown function (DUF6134)
MNGWFREWLCVSLLIACNAVSAQSQKWDFQVFLDDQAIGHHHFTLREAGQERELKSEARFDVKLLFITAYRYAHDASERWRGNCLAQIHARTDDNGTKSEVGAEPKDGCVMSFAYWNPEMLQQTRLLNAQTGKLETISITPQGEEKISVRGTPTLAKRYRITGPKHPIDLWYGADRSWLALQSTLENGRRLRYQLK